MNRQLTLNNLVKTRVGLFQDSLNVLNNSVGSLWEFTFNGLTLWGQWNLTRDVNETFKHVLVTLIAESVVTEERIPFSAIRTVDLNGLGVRSSSWWSVLGGNLYLSVSSVYVDGDSKYPCVGKTMA